MRDKKNKNAVLILILEKGRLIVRFTDFEF